MPDSPPSAVTDSFRHAMSQLVTGVVMVTTTIDGRPWGLTVSACCSVSMDPPLLLVSLGERTASAQAIRANGTFGVSILGQRAIDAARFGSAQGQPKFAEDYCTPPEDDAGASQSPVVASSLCHVDCTLFAEVEAGDHRLFIGEVQHVVVADPDDPLAYFSRGYHQITPLTDEEQAS